MALIADSPTDRAEQLLLATERLTALVVEETRRIDAREPPLDGALAEEKQRRWFIPCPRDDGGDLRTNAGPAICEGRCRRDQHEDANENYLHFPPHCHDLPRRFPLEISDWPTPHRVQSVVQRAKLIREQELGFPAGRIMVELRGPHRYGSA